MRRQKTLGQAFTLMLTLVFLGSVVLSGIILSSAMQRTAERQVASQAETLIQTMNAVRDYTGAQIAPLLEASVDTEERFVPEQIPAYAARTVFTRFREQPQYESFLYKEATPSPLNPLDQADDFERGLVEQFRQSPAVTELTGYRDRDGETLFYIARPFKVNQASCLECHGDPARAPESQRRVYGSTSGYNWRINEIVSAQTIYVPATDVFGQGRRHLIMVMLIFTGIFTLTILLINRLLRNAVIAPIKQLTAICRSVSKDNPASQAIAAESQELEQLASRRDEPGQLARAFGLMAATSYDLYSQMERNVQERTAELASANTEITTLNQRLEADNLRMAAELDISHRLQALILPKPSELHQVAPLEIAAAMTPAEEVGGDYYDVLQCRDRVQIGIGDVTGHGLESGMLMLMAQTAVRTLMLHGESDLVKVLNTLNQTLYANVERMASGRNMTLTLLNYASGRVTIAGQHEEVILVRQTGELERIDTIELGFPIGLEGDITKFTTEAHVDLAPGDGIILYTDGIPEAEDELGNFYGIERLCELAKAHWHLSAEDLRQHILQDVEAHIGEQTLFDDVTLLIFKRPLD